MKNALNDHVPGVGRQGEVEGAIDGQNAARLSFRLVARHVADLGAGEDKDLVAETNSPRRLVDAALTTARLTEVFDVIVTSDDVERSKPAPDIYRLVCERLGVAPEHVLALEDSAAGIASAKAAGLACIAVPQFVETDVAAADRVIDSLEELLPEF